ncbi:helix-turn-helix domain-containing protein [Gleimia coleocanis]|uniref:helix-turn-helix domain-containing protein n=1 Tax=Gleimia coleocanis TaxID=103618 RepID=UPI000A07BDB0
MKTFSITPELTEIPDLAAVVASNIRAFAARLNWSQSDLARALGMKQPTVSQKWNEMRAWKLEELGYVAHVLNVTVAELVTPPAGYDRWYNKNRPTGEIHQAGGWRARRDSNPQPSDP